MFVKNLPVVEFYNNIQIMTYLFEQREYMDL